MRKMLLMTLGFTQSARERDYSSFSDGYRLGEAQTSVTVSLPDWLESVEPDKLAEAAFVASNIRGMDYEPSNGIATAIYSALDTVPVSMRSLSTGDTVTVKGQMWACEDVGWQRIDEPDRK